MSRSQITCCQGFQLMSHVLWMFCCAVLELGRIVWIAIFNQTCAVKNMALVESEIAFQKRCDELEAGLYAKCRGQDIFSFSTLAFSLGSPQNQVNDAELAELAAKIHGGDASVGSTANIRRLHFDACTFLMADMKTQVSSTDPSEPVRKLPLWRSRTVWRRKRGASQACPTGLISNHRIS